MVKREKSALRKLIDERVIRDLDGIQSLVRDCYSLGKEFLLLRRRYPNQVHSPVGECAGMISCPQHLTIIIPNLVKNCHFLPCDDLLRLVPGYRQSGTTLLTLHQEAYTQQ